MTKVLVCGDRNWEDIDTIRSELRSIPNLEMVIEGNAPGADRLSRLVGVGDLNVPVLTVPADWTKYKKAAGPVRNRKMLDYKPDRVLAFHDNISESKGTKNMVELARKFKIPVKVVKSRGVKSR